MTTLDRLGRSSQNMLALTENPKERGAALRVLNLGGRDIDTATVMGSMVFTVTELQIDRERVTDSVSKRRAAGKDLGGRRLAFATPQIENAARLIDAGAPATQVARDLSMFRATLY